MKFSLKYTFLLFSMAFSSSVLLSQTPLAEAQRTAEMPPQWPGCTKEATDCTRSRLNQFIEANLQLPPEAKTQNAGGVVMVEFVVEKNGTIGDVRALHDPGFGLGTEAVRVVSLMKEKKIKWSPAEDKGKRIPFRYMIPVSYNLSKPAAKQPAPAVKPVELPQVFDVVEVMPMYEGCVSTPDDSIDCTFMQMIRHFKTNLVYPDTALKSGVQGPVVVEFVIDTYGAVTNAVVQKGIGYGCDEEALRLISLMPVWQPGRHNGEPVPVRMVVPVMFQISQPNKE